jgi:hypothetical protein
MIFRRGEVGPFELHLREAIALNRERAPLYARLSEGRSRAISRSLILQERLLLPVARWFDGRAEPYHRAGVPLLGDAFVSMDRTPAFAAPGHPLPAPPRLRPNGRHLARAVRAALRGEGLPAAERIMRREIETLSAEPRVSRHAATHARIHPPDRRARPHHERMASDRGLPSPRPISLRILRLHLRGFPAAVRLDRRAEPLQRRGIPIIVNDVPPIPYEI